MSLKPLRLEESRILLLAALWAGVVRCDLAVPLGHESLLEVPAGRRDSVVSAQVGSRVWLEGEFVGIESIADGLATLRCGDRVSTMTVARLAGLGDELQDPADPDSSPPEGSLLGSVALSTLTKKARAETERLAAAIREVLSDESRPLTPRVAALARAEGVSVRTMERKVTAFRRRGIAGLINSRATRSSATRVDPRWDEACQAVLRSYTSKSTPSRAAVIGQVAVRLEEQHGPGVVPLPVGHGVPAVERAVQGEVLVWFGAWATFGGEPPHRDAGGACVLIGRVSTSCWIRTRWTCTRWSR